jgi:hypothetical protein
MIHLTAEDIAAIKQKPVLKLLFARAHAEVNEIAQRIRSDPNYKNNVELQKLFETLDHVEDIRAALAMSSRRRAKKARTQASAGATASP